MVMKPQQKIVIGVVVAVVLIFMLMMMKKGRSRRGMVTDAPVVTYVPTGMPISMPTVPTTTQMPMKMTASPTGMPATQGPMMTMGGGPMMTMGPGIPGTGPPTSMMMMMGGWDMDDAPYADFETPRP